MRRIPLAWLMMALLSQACGRSQSTPIPLNANLAQPELSQTTSQGIDRELDLLEARLEQAHSQVNLWTELAKRRQQVSAIACKNAQMHADAMLFNSRRQRALLALKAELTR